jgi:hypothetical protein
MLLAVTGNNELATSVSATTKKTEIGNKKQQHLSQFFSCKLQTVAVTTRLSFFDTKDT